MPRNAATSKTSTRSSSRTMHGSTTAKSTSHDALALLKEDHQKVKKMFAQFEKMKKDDKADDQEKQQLVQTVCTELTMHAQLEEEIFYPAMREAIDDMDMLDEAEVEHASAKQLITELSSMNPGDELYDAKVTVLGEYVNHHVEEEEGEMFKAAKKAKVDLKELGERLLERKESLRQEFGMMDMEHEDEEDAATHRASRSKRLH